MAKGGFERRDPAFAIVRWRFTLNGPVEIASEDDSATHHAQIADVKQECDAHGPPLGALIVDVNIGDCEVGPRLVGRPSRFGLLLSVASRIGSLLPLPSPYPHLSPRSCHCSVVLYCQVVTAVMQFATLARTAAAVSFRAQLASGELYMISSGPKLSILFMSSTTCGRRST